MAILRWASDPFSRSRPQNSCSSNYLLGNTLSPPGSLKRASRWCIRNAVSGKLISSSPRPTEPRADRGFEVPKPRRVLFVDGEMPGEAIQQRLASLVAGFPKQPPSPEYFRILCADTIEQGLPDLGTSAGQSEIDAIVGDAEAIYVDNLSSL